jgi:alkanesulfonate monooxygenase SsuD/methylene tetrahydromethanopterin reductase-like flavin-dependent oxidoreductase (luciferase family)
MQIGIGLPNPVKGVTGRLLLDWARTAEARGFAALATIDRIAYPNFDSITTLAAAAGATSRIGLVTNILLAPAYQPVVLAKSAASLDQLSGGRLTLGLAPGGRADDFVATGRDFHTRGREFDAQLDLLHRAWRGEPVAGVTEAVCPRPVKEDRIPILIGGHGEKAVQRAAAWGAGWSAGGGGPAMAAPLIEQVRTAWRQAGRQGEPRLAALTYFSLGPDADEDSRAYLRDYYAVLGPFADQIAESALRSEAAIRDAVRAFEDLGITELYFPPTVASLDQVDRLADAVL